MFETWTRKDRPEHQNAQTDRSLSKQADVKMSLKQMFYRAAIFLFKDIYLIFYDVISLMCDAI